MRYFAFSGKIFGQFYSKTLGQTLFKVCTVELPKNIHETCHFFFVHSWNLPYPIGWMYGIRPTNLPKKEINHIVKYSSPVDRLGYIRYTFVKPNQFFISHRWQWLWQHNSIEIWPWRAFLQVRCGLLHRRQAGRRPTVFVETISEQWRKALQKLFRLYRG